MKEEKENKREKNRSQAIKKWYAFCSIIIIAVLIASTFISNTPSRRIAKLKQNQKKETEYGYNKPYLPEGFSYVEGEWNSGYVIQDQANGNQFVWVPVDGTNVKLDRKNFTVTAISYQNCYEEINSTYAQSVTQYGGFYIARYEAGLPEGVGTEETKEARNVGGIPVSKKGARVWNYINYETAKSNAEEMYASNIELTSSLMSSYAFDTTLTWLEQSGYNVDTDSSVWGNYSSHAGTNHRVETAGSNSEYQANHIYDLAGNVEEWTVEKNNTNQVTRGGNYTNAGNVAPTGDRTSTTTSRTANTIGYRPILYKTGTSIIQGYDTPYLPTGFKHVEGQWNSGYVIEDEANGNQYVWIPVSGKENAILQRKDFANTFVAKDKAMDNLELTFKISVYRNGGFYVARYEAGTPEGQTLENNSQSRNISGIPVSKKNVDTWTNINYQNAQSNAKKMYQNNQEVESKLMNSYAYDVMMTWLEQSGHSINDSTTWGNYLNNAKNNQTLKTGIEESFKANNIYDLAGNVWEMTTETYGSEDIIVRGGDYLSNGDAIPAGTREHSSKTQTYDYTGFRTILYKRVTNTTEEGVRNGSNIPQITNGMIPVKWDGNNWISTTVDDATWYNYETQQWANVMLEDGSMLVWVPRYAYRITSNYHINSSTGGNIEVKFLKGQTNNPIDGSETVLNKEAGDNVWTVPEAFTYGDKQLEGIWIGKYRVSRQDATASALGSSTKLQIKSGYYSNYDTLNNSFNKALAINEENNIFGLPTDDNIVDPHLVKNTEWGAISYLTQSNYGRNGTKLTTNTGYQSGAGGINTTTTGNETGIYDMAGRQELVAAYVDNTYANTYASNIVAAENKYKDVYSIGTNDESNENYEANKTRTDAIYEVSETATGGAWYQATSTYAYGSYPLIYRGATGIYSFNQHNSSTFASHIAIAVITPIGTINENQLREIQLSVDTTAARNTKIEGSQNGIKAGPITLSINYENFETDNNKKYQYRVGGENAEWMMADKLQKLAIKENTTVDVRYYDGQNAYRQKSINITNVDTIRPEEFELNVVVTDTQITIDGTTTDTANEGAASEIPGILRYEYKIDNEPWQEVATFTGLLPGTNHTISMKAIDKAGNERLAENSRLTVRTGYGIVQYDNTSNIPILTQGMTPVKWNGSTWIDTEVTDSDWYNYEKKEWANVRLEDGSMFVWIPRYAYNIDNNWGTMNVTNMKVKFLKGKTNNPIDGTESITNEIPGEGNWLVHPAFQFGEDAIEGLWIAKYQARYEGKDDTDFSIKNTGTKIGLSNTAASPKTTIAKEYLLATKMNQKDNKYGLYTKNEKVDPHLLKSTEWGSFAYLTFSQYGKSSKLTKWVESTTGNETGIYDWSYYESGTWYPSGKRYNNYHYEVFASYVNNGNNSLTTNGKSLLEAPSKHKDSYQTGTTDNSVNNHEANKNTYGNGIYELNNVPNGFPNTSSPFFVMSPFVYRTINGVTSYTQTTSTTTELNLYFRPSIAITRKANKIEPSKLEEIVIEADETSARNTQSIGEQNGINTGPITITINFNNKDINNLIQYQYKIGEDGKWYDAEKIQTLKVTENGKIYARYYDGKTEYNVQTYEVNNVDNVKPEGFKLKVITGQNNIILQGETTDKANQGAAAEISGLRYRYRIDNGDWQNESEFTNLMSGTKHTVFMKAIDKAGNEINAYNSGTIVIVGQGISDDNGVSNIPKLTAGMTPIKWDGTNWVDTTTNDSEWYDYQNKQWANVRLEDGSMFVWIPRYAYQINTNYHKSSATAGEIQIKFLKGKTNNTVDGTNIAITRESGEGNWLVNPAFEYGEQELEGIWIGKFETSMSDATENSYNTTSPSGYHGGTSEQIKIIPEVTSWRNITTGEAYNKATAMNEENNGYGLFAEDRKVDPHLLKNTEWGAVAYLAQSNYGKNSELFNNNHSYYITGKSSGATGLGSSTAGYSYHTAQGQGASTTGNISGIYDMNGGASETVAAYLNNGNSYLQTNAKSLLEAPSQHKDVYEMGATDTPANNYIKTREKYGDAVYETSANTGAVAWYNDTMHMPYGNYALFTRGFNRNGAANAGIFSNTVSNGAKGSEMGFRIAIAITEAEEIDSSKLNEIQVIPDITTPRNTDQVGSQNGIETGPVTLTINYENTDINNRIQYQYRVGEIGRWQNAEKIQEVPIYENTAVYVRYYDGQTAYQTKTFTVTNIDNTRPQITAMDIEKQGSTLTIITVNSDEGGAVEGINGIKQVVYQLNNGNWQESNIFTNVTTDTYQVNAKAIDKAGNETIGITIVENGKVVTQSIDKTRFGANMPVLTKGMTPVKWNGTAWEDTVQSDKDWFNYEKKEWANVRLEDGSMFVWIPRYAYNIDTNYATYAGAAGIPDYQIKFLKATGNTPTDGSSIELKNASGKGNWNLHPAFSYQGRQLEGIWIAKYQASHSDATSSSVGTSATISFKEGVRSYRTDINTAYSLVTTMNQENNSYGLMTGEKIDIHLIKNMEWGSMAYLTNSSYGQNKRIATGNTLTTAYGGVNGSTTGNATGIYDISTSYELVAAYVDNGNVNLTNYAKKLLDAPSQHKDIYYKGVSDNSANNKAANSDKYGDAVYETSNPSYTFYGGTATFPYSTSSIFIRSSNDPLSYSIQPGNASYGFRAVIIPNRDTITITQNVTTPRNTTKVGEQNGVATGPITVTIDYGNTDLVNANKYQYKIGEGSWQTASPIQTLEITENTTIYARYNNGNETSESIAHNILNVVNTPPAEPSFEVEVTSGTMKVKVQKTDEKLHYKYQLNNNNWQTTEVFENIEKDVTYTIKVKAIDEAGNETIKSTQATGVE